MYVSQKIQGGSSVLKMLISGGFFSMGKGKMSLFLADCFQISV